MVNTDFDKILCDHQIFFNSRATYNINFRINQLKKLKYLIKDNETIIYEALKKDLGKCNFESYVSEIGFVISELNHIINNLREWCKSEKVKTPLTAFPGKSYIVNEPYGSVLIIGPWNYPFHLIFAPLIGAIAAGNCAVVKPSELSPNISNVITNLINNNFNPKYLYSVQGGVDETSKLLSLHWDYIFFTGSENVGKIVMEAASKNLIPTTLELGGKSPCIVDKCTDLEISAKRIAWGKFFNTGQTCVAPDYLFIHKDVVHQFIPLLIKYIKEFYGENAINSPHYGRIINEKHFDRLSSYLEDGKVIFGGETKKEELYISPTLMIGTKINSLVMKEEIFGPILPMLQFDNLDQVIYFINSRPKPLSLYYFSRNNKNIDKLIKSTSSGSVCINETLSQINSPYLPFGGVGNSGLGKYHGKWSYYSFTHQRSVMKRSFLFDLKLKYPPYNVPLNLLKKLLE
ncbi:aldehyde dehydrogenase [Clostridium sp. MSJ-11]|uniref:Aldehyde dehydrogenase n=1 Tax=Clostridium mobile TaxID=2841512 RepID=A0ABS6EHX5_9CLOT|nr:aldehyde dehydrogenase [Clostridium mobile]MBU5484806.1 aldehyde dehydrogenase [Clostridium mobile]